MEFYKISHDGGCDIKIVLANNKYEALGFYYLEGLKDDWMESIDEIELLSHDHKVEVSCVGFPIYKTVQEIYMEENEHLPCPTIVCELID